MRGALVRRALPAALALAALAPAAPAAADGPRMGPYHGGRPAEDPVLVYLLVAGDGRLDAAVTLRSRCDAYPVPVQARVAVSGARLDDAGEATAVRRITGTVSGPDGRRATEDGEATVRVRVGDDGRATGTVRLTSVFTDAEDGSEVARCDTGELAFAVRQVPGRLPRRGARPAAGTELVGVAGVQPLVARVDEDGDLAGLALVYRSGCQARADGRGTRRIVALPTVPVRRDGTFAVRAVNQLFLGAGGEERVRIELRGRLGRGATVRGTVRLRGTLTRDEDAEPATCDSGTLRVRGLPG
jgi:hypothetical protein